MTQVANLISLGGGLGRAATAALTPSEVVLDQLEGQTGEAIVVTTKRVLIIKAGYAAQAMFGQKVKSYPYDMISSVEVSAGLISGRIQITVSGAHEGSGSNNKTSTAQKENLVQIFRNQLDHARAIGNLIEEKRDAMRHAPAAQASTASLADELMKLAQLRDTGVLSPTEFETAKQRLLSK